MTTLRLMTRIGQTVWQQRQGMQLTVLGNMKYRSWYLLNSHSTTQCISLAPFVSSRHSFSTKKTADLAGKTDTKSSPVLADEDIFGEASKLGLFAKFKLMYKKYWYVLLPVHVVTSIGWFGGFYYLSKSGVDIPLLLQHMHLSESIVERFQNSSMGHYAIAYLCYKVATPLRYAVTLGGTTVSIKYLVQAGHIKPIPSKRELLQMYEKNKADRAAAKLEGIEEKQKTKGNE
ncbi:protein FAM210A [Bactrocera neohumeralis]|uniref:protein FAM210A n=1 Tax=Bactrocera tryoni TaxID=59916 RepID=UPI001A99F0F7|nr:protein FAM210A [Bactrocera tryoni]XP_039958728.1 protein FAM210A [Bactrocera tryoni]XP_050328559.1 protein FAM210A [Bactrocera neohumeralis]XP_050328560.1 protein FAM210A [Bactrocera neohumeralis]